MSMSERLSGESNITREGSSNGHTGDKIVEEGLRVLEEFTKREKLEPRDEPRRFPRVKSRNGGEKKDMEWEKREGMTALSFLSLNPGERAPRRELSISIPSPPQPKQIPQRALEPIKSEKRLSILHIIPPEERNRIGPSALISPTSTPRGKSFLPSISSPVPGSTPRHKPSAPTMYPLYSAVATSPISPPTALSPPPRSRKMTSRGGSAPISPQPRVLGLELGSGLRSGNDKCLSMGALGGNSLFDTVSFVLITRKKIYPVTFLISRKRYQRS